MAEMLRDTVAKILQDYGWSREIAPAIASKEYQTIVGPNQAHAYLMETGPAGEYNVLQGNYQSEGRNILEVHSVLIPRTADIDTAIQLIRRFAVCADAAIADSYATRLLRLKSPGDRRDE